MFPEAIEALARQKAGKGDEWSPYIMRAVPMPPKPLEGIQITGANHRALLRGPRKGERTWTNEGKVTVFVTAAEYRAAVSQQ